jgi:hypothetical protein
MKRLSLLVLLVFGLASLPAAAHTERPAYWPDPAVDTSVEGGTGGKVPKARSLASALNGKLVGDTRVVCKANSLKLLNRSIAKARKSGYDIRPSDHRKLSAKQAKKLKKINKKLFKRCRYKEIQPAVFDSKNNDRVVIMPGLYTEPTSRSKPTHDTACDKFRTSGDRPGQEGQALSYEYQFNCPNDQNLIAVMGREPGAEPPPIPPRENRHGIPDEGPCIRCNLQIEGSGVNADDVIIDAGDPKKGDGGPNGAGTKKDVGIRADRADGFVLKNVKVRHAKEHGIYVLESDGYLLTHFKVYYNGLYGTLTFVEDHGRQEHCDGAGHGDSAIYPGAAVETGEQRPAGTDFRHNQEIRFCDMHHNMAGYSGTNGNAVWVHDNNFYDNVLGLQTDVVTGAGHPGYPGDSMLIEKNNFYSNNFNIYAEDSQVKPAFPFPMGTGLWIAGGNHHVVRDNYIYDNWRRGTMLFSVPDQLVCGETAGGNYQAGCDPNAAVPTTSHYNSQYNNHMGVRPDGTADPNGTDFWWDPYRGTVGNCWFNNTPAKGAELTYSPTFPAFPDCDNGKDPNSSIGLGNDAQTAELLSCVLAFETRNFDPEGPCPWFKQPEEPQPNDNPMGSRSASRTANPFAPQFVKQLPLEDGAVDKRADLSGVNCANWRLAGDEGRDWLVDVITRFAGGDVNGPTSKLGQGNTLPADTAKAMFNSWCVNDYAQGFLLYKLYTYSAAAELQKN